MADPYADLGVEDDEEYKALGMEDDTAPPVPDASSVAPEPFGPTENPVHTPGMGETFVQGAGNAIAGTGDLWGAIGQAGLSEMTSLPDFLRGKMTLAELQAARNRIFREARQDNLSRTRRGGEEHPVANFAGRMLPNVLLAPVAGVGNSLAAAATSGAVQGGVEGAAQSNAGSVGEVLEDAARGGTFGGAGGAAGYLLAKGAGKLVSAGAERLDDAWQASSLRDWFERQARERALKASGYIQKDFPNRADAPARLERLLEQGQTLLDEPGLIGPFSGKAGIVDRLEPLVDREGRRIGAALDAADAASGNAAQDLAGTGGYNPYSFIEKVQKEVATPAVRNPSLEAEGRGAEGWLGRLRQTANEQAAEGTPFTFRQANEYKGDLQSKVFNATGTPKANAAVRNELQGVMTRDLDDQAEPLLGASQLADFQDARRKFGAFKGALGKSVEGVNREVGNNGLGLKDWQAAQTFTAAAKDAGGWFGPAVALGSKLVRGRADSFAARTADAIAQPDWLQTLATTQPEVLGKWGQYLGAAAARGPQALSEAHFEAGQSDPDYQRRLRDAGKGQ